MAVETNRSQPLVQGDKHTCGESMAFELNDTSLSLIHYRSRVYLCSSWSPKRVYLFKLLLKTSKGLISDFEGLNCDNKKFHKLHS